jgi:hypothetical protein
MHIDHYKYDNGELILLKTIKLNDLASNIRDDMGNYLDISEHHKLMAIDMNDPKLYNYRIIYNIPFMLLINPINENDIVKFNWYDKQIEIKLNEVFEDDM